MDLFIQRSTSAVSFNLVPYRGNKLFGFDQVFQGAEVPQLRKQIRNYLRNRTSDRPLCLFAGTSNPHVPWAPKSSFDPADVEFPPHQLDTPATRAHRAAYYQEIKQLDRLLGELRQMAANHLGENTLFVHTSDHGSQWPFGKWNLYDYGTRVPLIASWPGHIEVGTTSDAMVSWVDLLPTLLEVADGSTPDGIDGQSFAGVLLGKSSKHRDLIFTTHTADGKKNQYPMRSVRTRQWKLIHNLDPNGTHTNHSDLDRKPLAGAYWNEWMALAETDPHARELIERYHHRPE